MATLQHVPTELLKEMGVKEKDISRANNAEKVEELVREGVKNFPSGRKR